MQHLQYKKNKGQDCLKSYLADINHSVTSEMAYSSHTLPCCLSKLRSRQEAGKKQPLVWLEYGNSVAEVSLYSSFGAPLVPLRSPYDDSEMARNEFEEGSKMHIITSICGMSSGAGFVYLQNYGNKPLNLYPSSRVSNHPLEYFDIVCCVDK